MSFLSSPPNAQDAAAWTSTDGADDEYSIGNDEDCLQVVTMGSSQKAAALPLSALVADVLDGWSPQNLDDLFEDDEEATSQNQTCLSTDISPIGSGFDLESTQRQQPSSQEVSDGENRTRTVSILRFCAYLTSIYPSFTGR